MLKYTIKTTGKIIHIILGHLYHSLFAIFSITRLFKNDKEIYFKVSNQEIKNTLICNF